jgi:hypothetical protein
MRWRRMRLRRLDGRVYLDRWGVGIGRSDRWGGLLIHRFTAGDPIKHLHDHPWTFVSLVVRGAYSETIVSGGPAKSVWARRVLRLPSGRGSYLRRRTWLSVGGVRPGDQHRVLTVDRSPCWTIVIHGFRRKQWGYYTSAGFIDVQSFAVGTADDRELVDDFSRGVG